MVNPPIEELAKHVDCRYTLVVQLSRRARQIVQGSQPLYETNDENFKPVSVAAQEIVRGLLGYRSASRDS